MDIPSSMNAELGAWNNGKGIDIEGWVCFEGNFSLAVGYLSVLWPEFEEVEGYILRKGVPIEVLRGFEEQENSTRRFVESTINHLHLSDIHSSDESDCTADKLLLIGSKLKEIYEAKLEKQFSSYPCKVVFHVPDNAEDLDEYQLTFWQIVHDV
jgi:hypothetical protein